MTTSPVNEMDLTREFDEEYATFRSPQRPTILFDAEEARKWAEETLRLLDDASARPPKSRLILRRSRKHFSLEFRGTHVGLLDRDFAREWVRDLLIWSLERAMDEAVDKYEKAMKGLNVAKEQYLAARTGPRLEVDKSSIETVEGFLAQSTEHRKRLALEVSEVEVMTNEIETVARCVAWWASEEMRLQKQLRRLNQ